LSYVGAHVGIPCGPSVSRQHRAPTHSGQPTPCSVARDGAAQGLLAGLFLAPEERGSR